jgi:sugar lactone lactonase YvrE
MAFFLWSSPMTAQTNRIRRQRLAAMALAFLSAGSPAAAQGDPLPAHVRVAAEFPTGTFLENLHVTTDGAMVFTSYFAREIGLLGADGTPRTFSRLPVHPVGIAPAAGGYLVTAHGKAFTAGPDFTQTQQVLVLDAAGAVTATLPAPQALFLNGVMRLDDNVFLAADSIAATIWRIDLTAMAITPWLQDAGLSRDSSQQAFRPGANGVKRVGDRLIVSNSSRGTLSAVRITADGKPDGALHQIADVGAIDDFLIEDTGAIVYTTHGEKLMRLAPSGARTEIMDRGCGGCTSVALAKPSDARSDLIVLTTGGLLEGGKKPARILVVPSR